MQDNWDLEDWLLDAGKAAEEKHIGGTRLSPIENLIRELWVFDMQSVNGGVSQYFCNCAERWPVLVAAASAFPIEQLQLLIERVEQAINGSSDPYSELLEASGLDEFYQDNRLAVWSQVQTLVSAV